MQRQIQLHLADIGNCTAGNSSAGCYHQHIAYPLFILLVTNLRCYRGAWGTSSNLTLPVGRDAAYFQPGSKGSAQSCHRLGRAWAHLGTSSVKGRKVFRSSLSWKSWESHPDCHQVPKNMRKHFPTDHPGVLGLPTAHPRSVLWNGWESSAKWVANKSFA